MVKKLRNKKFFPLIPKVIIVSVIFLQFLFVLNVNKEKFISPNYESLYESYKEMYYSSQYATKTPTVIIGDEIFEAFAGGAFLKGMNPIHIVHDHPPMGRYLVSLSILLFNNAQTIVVLAMITSFVGIFLTARIFVKDFYLSLIPIAIFANEPLSISKLIYTPLPEPIHLPFIIFSIYFFMKAVTSDKKWLYLVLTSLLLGFVISIRFFVTGGVIISAMIITLLLHREFKILQKFLLTLPIAFGVLCLAYTKSIIDSGSIFQVFSIQKYILFYHKSAFTNAFSFWDLLLFNRWHTWWGDRSILSDSNWIVLWPISSITTILGIGILIFKKVKISIVETLVILWISLYCIMLSTGYTSTRYFFPIMPYFYILMVWVLVRIYEGVKKAK